MKCKEEASSNLNTLKIFASPPVNVIVIVNPSPELSVLVIGPLGDPNISPFSGTNHTKK